MIAVAQQKIYSLGPNHQTMITRMVRLLKKVQVEFHAVEARAGEGGNGFQTPRDVKGEFGSVERDRDSQVAACEGAVIA